VSDRILLFIPCYNCAPQIGRVLDQVRGPIRSQIAEVLVLDNGSQDGTLDEALKAAAGIEGPQVTIARNQSNYHLGGSHKAAFAYASAHGFSHVLVLHGDDQGRLADIGPVLERGEHRTHDACLGARFMPGSELGGYSVLRRLGNAAFNLIFTAVSGRRVRDLGSGLNIFSRAVFADPRIGLYSDDLRFNVFLLLGLIDRRSRLMFFPISWREEDQVSNVRLVSQSIGTLTIAWDYLARRSRFRAADHRDRPVAAYAFDILSQGPAHG
jgi:glycosyltransferase involved in cell wall biosynthesis